MTIQNAGPYRANTDRIAAVVLPKISLHATQREMRKALELLERDPCAMALASQTESLELAHNLRINAERVRARAVLVELIFFALSGLLVLAAFLLASFGLAQLTIAAAKEGQETLGAVALMCFLIGLFGIALLVKAPLWIEKGADLIFSSEAHLANRMDCAVQGIAQSRQTKAFFCIDSPDAELVTMRVSTEASTSGMGKEPTDKAQESPGHAIEEPSTH